MTYWFSCGGGNPLVFKRFVLALVASLEPSLEMENEEKIRKEARRRLEEQLKQYRVQRQKERVSTYWHLLHFLLLFIKRNVKPHHSDDPNAQVDSIVLSEQVLKCNGLLQYKIHLPNSSHPCMRNCIVNKKVANVVGNYGFEK